MADKKVTQNGSFLGVFDGLCTVFAHISAWMILAMALAIGYEVIVRYFFLQPTTWAIDFIDYALLYSTFLASAWLLRRGEHVNLTIVVQRLSPRSQQLMKVINSFLGVAVCGFLIWYGAADTWDAFDRSISMDRPVAVPKFLIVGIIPFGALLLLTEFVRNGLASIGALRDLK